MGLGPWLEEEPVVQFKKIKCPKCKTRLVVRLKTNAKNFRCPNEGCKKLLSLPKSMLPPSAPAD